MYNNKIISVLKSVEITQDMVNRNYDEMIKLIDHYEKEQNLNFDKDRKLITEYHKELNRLLHNYLSSTYTLIEHTRMFRKKLNNDKFEELFQDKFSKLLNNEIYCFYKNLRTYCQHFNIPPTTASVKIISIKTMDCYAQNFSFDTEEILNWKNLPDDISNFIEEKENKIDLKETLKDFHYFFMKFNKWVINTAKNYLE